MLDGRARSVWTALLTALIDLDGTEAAGLNRSALGLAREPRRGNRRAGAYFEEDDVTIPFARSQLCESRYFCTFFNSDDEEYRVLLPFIKDGYDCGDKLADVVNSDQRRDHLQRLAGVGVDAAVARQGGQAARRMIRDGNRASEVITRLRALFSKKDATGETVDLNEAALEVIALCLNALQKSRVILGQELADERPPVTGDCIQLLQVILNLLWNASDAMSGIGARPKRLVIRSNRDDGDSVCVSVQDVGVGIAPRTMNRLFEAFYTTKCDGMGMGLSISRAIIVNHYGRLWTAPNDGLGATFSFSIPRGPEGVADGRNLGATGTLAEADAAKLMRNA